MKSTASLKKGIESARQKWRAGNYDRALAEVEKLLETWPDNPALLVMWAGLVQLQEETNHTLEDVRRALERAADLDPESPAARIELGHFPNAAEDDVPAAADAFEKAAALARRHLVDSLLGRARTLSQLGRTSEALGCVMEAYWLQTEHRPPAPGAGKAGSTSMSKGGTTRSDSVLKAGPMPEEFAEILESLRISCEA